MVSGAKGSEALSQWNEIERQQQNDRETAIAKLWNVAPDGKDFGVDPADERLLARKLKETNG